MNNKVVISILGCGWLGLALSKTLISEKFVVKGSTTSSLKMKVLSDAGVEPYLVHFNKENVSKNLIKFLTCDILIIAVPPGRNNIDRNENYRQLVSEVKQQIPNSIKKIILISSTSVYAETNLEVNENSPLSNLPTAKVLLDAEYEFKKLVNTKLIILRLSGLIGPERHPSRFFAGKSEIPDGLAPVNLVHQTDVINLILEVLQNDNADGTYNVSSPSHPTRQEFYTKAASLAGLKIPQFVHEKKNWKIINSFRLKNELKFSFKVGDLMKWLDSE